MPKSRANTFCFEGFQAPNTTPVPDELFDFLLPKLGEAELRVLLYVIRRTLGFKKSSDQISLKQLVDGIKTADGRVLDYGAGIAKSAAARAVRSLTEKGVLLAIRNRSPEKGDEPTTYVLHFRHDPVFSKRTRGVPPREHGGVLQVDTQQTVVQQTELLTSKRKRVKRKGFTPQELNPETPSVGRILAQTRTKYLKPSPKAACPALEVVIMEVSAELGDSQHLPSNLTQASRLLQTAQLPEASVVQLAGEAASIVRDKLQRSGRDGSQPIRNKMAYYFATLKDLLGREDRGDAS